MTITRLFMILALTVGAGTSQPVESDSSLCPPGRVCIIRGDCWINGVWYNPCPNDAPPTPDPSPVLLPPT